MFDKFIQYTWCSSPCPQATSRKPRGFQSPGSAIHLHTSGEDKDSANTYVLLWYYYTIHHCQTCQPRIMKYTILPSEYLFLTSVYVENNEENQCIIKPAVHVSELYVCMASFEMLNHGECRPFRQDKIICKPKVEFLPLNPESNLLARFIAKIHNWSIKWY